MFNIFEASNFFIFIILKFIGLWSIWGESWSCSIQRAWKSNYAETCYIFWTTSMDKCALRNGGKFSSFFLSL